MPDPSPTDIEAVLRVLEAHGVSYIIVGMVSAVIRGAPITTFDLDLVYDRREDNVQRVLAALDDLDAYVRIQNGQRLTVNESHLVTRGHKLLKTRFGRVDFLGAVGDDEDFDDLLPHTDEFELDGMRLSVLTLGKYIELKEHTGRPKDLAVLPVLRAVLREQQGGPPRY